MKTIVFVIFMSSFLFSCGPNKEVEAKQEKAKMDSVSNAVRSATNDSLKISKRVTELLEQKEFTQNAIEYLDATMNKLKSNQVAAEVDLENTKSFQLGRSSSEKQSQISNMVIKKKNIDESLESVSIALKIFKKVSVLMSDLETKKFKSITDLGAYESDMKLKIQSIESDLLTDSDNDRLKGFKFENVIAEKSFRREVERFKENKLSGSVDSVAYSK